MKRWLLPLICAFAALPGLAAEDASATPASRIVARLTPGLVAVEYQLQFDKGDAPVGVIGDVAPVGLCGSGLVDAVAELEAKRKAKAAKYYEAKKKSLALRAKAAAQVAA